MKWERSDENYPRLEATMEEAVEGFAAVMDEVMARANDQPFDTMVIDGWIDSNRWIAHLQMADVAVGYDTGFRVTLGLEDLEDLGRREALSHAAECVAAALEEVDGTLPVRLTTFGEGPLLEIDPIGHR